MLLVRRTLSQMSRIRVMSAPHGFCTHALTCALNVGKLIDGVSIDFMIFG